MMSATRAVSLIKLDPPAEREDEWNEWYSAVHSPGRFECGFLAFRRFRIMEGEPPVDTRQAGQAKYLAIMELPHTAVLTSPEYDAVTQRWLATPPDSFEHLTMTLPNFARGVFEELGKYGEDYNGVLPENRTIFMSAHEVPTAIQDEFNDWYVTEHIPPILAAEGFNSVRRFVHRSDEFPPMLSRGGELFTHFALWEIESEMVFRNPIFSGYTPTPWQQRMRRMFTVKMSNVYQEIARGVAP